MGEVITFPVERKRSLWLSTTQRQCLHFVGEYRAKHDGEWPTFDEIGRALGLKSKAGVVRTVNALFRAGALDRPGEGK